MFGRYFPWKDVERSKNDTRLQSLHSVDEAKQTYLLQARECKRCKEQPDNLTWVYFRSPDWTWEKLCGRAGWLTICEKCRRQVDFFLEIMN
jgi:hypothetical protein